MLKDPELKLFGRMISLPENRAVFAAGEHSGESSNESSNGNVHCDRCSDESKVDEAGGDENPMQKDEEQAEGEVCETSADNEDEDPEGSGNTTNGDESGKSCPTDDQPKKDLKKPDKILPCPRCKSMDTKFCYYNNYNANQPRHFCKSCQRYWTAGGTMRNVPVGAGRRKNKNSASHCRHITISEALQAADPAHNLKFKPNGTVLSFGPDSPLCDSMASSLSLAEKTVVPNDGGRNGFQQPAVQNMTGFPPPVPCIPWSFPWNPAVPLPAIFPPYSLPLSYYPAPYIPCAWNLPWPSPTANQKVAASNPSSPLGKHSRNGELLNANTPKSSESSIVVPRTLRIDDPEEAAKSSIWSTLGIKYDSISREGLFKALQPKIDDKKPIPTANPLLQANPAALSRSLAFQETA